MKPSSKSHRLVFVLALCFTAVDAQACGEVMYRMGSALRYRSFITHHPANILLYSGPAGRAHATADGTKFHDNLEKAGHKVTLIEDPALLAQALAANNFDVVITYAGDLDAITTQLAQVQREPTLIPVVARNAPDENSLRARFPSVVSEDANLNQFLKVIEQSMKPRT